MQAKPIPVVDLFAGPGGLGEGFASAHRLSPACDPLFRVVLSIERDPDAHKTLRLRSFFRQFADGDAPEAYYQLCRGSTRVDKLFEEYPDQARRAREEAVCLELGPDNHAKVRELVSDARKGHMAWVLVGGPPCQAYSIAGRARNRSVAGYRPADDKRHFLYEEFLRVVAEHLPPVFVLENVKGLLSATVEDAKIFSRMYQDLSRPGLAVHGSRGKGTPSYTLVPLSGRSDGQQEFLAQHDPARFIVKMERHGIPQSRHRLILLGLRDDLATRVRPIDCARNTLTAGAVLAGLPALRSGLSQAEDSDAEWETTLLEVADAAWFQADHAEVPAWSTVRDEICKILDGLESPAAGRGGEFVPCRPSDGDAPEWYLDTRMDGIWNHETRSHMTSDLHRYLFASCFARVHNRSPVLGEFPRARFPCGLLPDHRNVLRALNNDGFFSDRFRVQIASEPATTVTSHISKDGHYYIHPDPSQCRSLTVREAARLQTFPDNYLFLGSRTAQYVQVGNAVPPLMSAEIARRIAAVLGSSLPR